MAKTMAASAAKTRAAPRMRRASGKARSSRIMVVTRDLWSFDWRLFKCDSGWGKEKHQDFIRGSTARRGNGLARKRREVNYKGRESFAATNERRLECRLNSIRPRKACQSR